MQVVEKYPAFFIEPEPRKNILKIIAQTIA